jgi:REP element-mobilizing transposase RayT
VTIINAPTITETPIVVQVVIVVVLVWCSCSVDSTSSTQSQCHHENSTLAPILNSTLSRPRPQLLSEVGTLLQFFQFHAQLSALRGEDLDMARKRRHWAPGKGHHLISRFIDRRFHLLSDHDREAYLTAYGAVQHRWDWQNLSYGLMSSHVHFGLIGGVQPLDRVFRSVHTKAAWRYHLGRTTLGPVLADRPRLYPVPDEALARLIAYHHRNPVSAGVVDRAANSRWTSHRAYLRLEKAPSWLDVERNLELIGFSDTKSGRAEFDDFVNEVALETPIPRLPNQREVLLTKPQPPLKDETWNRLLLQASSIVGCSSDELVHSRCHRASRGRRLVAQLGRDLFHQTYEEIGRRLGRTGASIHRLLHRPPKDGDILARQLAELAERL